MTANSSLVVGRVFYTIQNYFDGELKYLRVWNSVRTQTEIDNSISAGAPNLYNYYKYSLGLLLFIPMNSNEKKIYTYNNALIINQQGFIGIGTNNPISKLHVEDSIYCQGINNTLLTTSLTSFNGTKYLDSYDPTSNIRTSY